MSLSHILKNPIVAFSDYRKRRELKIALLALMAKRAPGMENGLQFEGVTLDNPTPENLSLVLVLREIVNEDRQFSIVNWPGGIALVRTAGVDNLSKDYQRVNEAANFIVRGGSDQAADLLEAVPKPIGPKSEN